MSFEQVLNDSGLSHLIPVAQLMGLLTPLNDPMRRLGEPGFVRTLLDTMAGARVDGNDLARLEAVLTGGAGAGAGGMAPPPAPSADELPGGVVGTEHPYPDNSDWTHIIHIPGASGIRILFSEHCSTEANYDYVQLLDRDGQPLPGTPEKYSGGRDGSSHNWPSSEIHIAGDYAAVKFVSDGSNNDWGFELGWVAEGVPSLPTWGPGGLLFESEHPYADNTTQEFIINIPGAEQLEIAFDPASSTEAQYDYCQFTDADGNVCGEERYSGGLNGTLKNFPSTAAPLVIPGDFAKCVFTSDGSNNDWGVAFGVRAPGTVSFEQFCNVPASTNCQIIESEHPYPDNADQTVALTMPGASEVRIAFDPLSCTEENYDYVQILDEDDNVIGEEKYHGGRSGRANFPAASNPLVIPGDFFKVVFKSDGSNNDWGWRLCATAFVPVPFLQFAEQPGTQWVESSHPYNDNADETMELSVPGASRIAIAFDPRSATEANFDYITFTDASGDQVGLDKYTGGYNNTRQVFPWASAPLIVDGSSVTMRWVSDGSNNDWGWRVAYRAV